MRGHNGFLGHIKARNYVIIIIKIIILTSKEYELLCRLVIEVCAWPQTLDHGPGSQIPVPLDAKFCHWTETCIILIGQVALRAHYVVLTSMRCRRIAST